MSPKEADTRTVLHILHAAEDDDKAIIVRYPDTYVMILLLMLAQSINRLILFDNGVANKIEDC
jgi:hypothetical protein